MLKETGTLEVPLHLRNAPTGLMKSLDYGKDYRYAHDEPDAYAAGETYLPEALLGQVFYRPLIVVLRSKSQKNWLLCVKRQRQKK